VRIADADCDQLLWVAVTLLLHLKLFFVIARNMSGPLNGLKECDMFIFPIAGFVIL